MKKLFGFFFFLMPVAAMVCACGGKDGDSNNENGSATECDTAIAMKEYREVNGDFHKTYLVANVDDHANVYKPKVDPAKALIVISKREYRLYVYEMGADTTLAATFPVCYAINPGPKSGEGDNKTPECTLQNPFHVSQIVDASTWCFDFNDGRGPILAFGNWFIRLDLSQSFPDNPALASNRSIGIHGSTGNEKSVPGRDSHGCVRMYDKDLDTLHDNYVAEGTTVVIKGIDEKKWPFEVKAEKALGDKYVAAKPGNPLLSK